jgi:polysaccharide export outer membrane protein
MKVIAKFFAFVLIIFAFYMVAWAQSETPIITETSSSLDIQLPAETTPAGFDPLKYTLGPDDAVEISVMRHPEFSGVYPINKEGKLQYKFVGDIEVNGMTKAQLEQKIKDALSVYVNSPEVNVTVTVYGSKVIYVLGEVGAPGKYYMQSEAITVREAVFQAGLPTASAAMRKCRLITPKVRGNAIVKNVNIYEILYGGNLKRNINMHPGDILYVPSTVMAKVIRVINPVASTVGLASSSATGTSDTRRAVNTMQGRPTPY